MDAQHRFLDDVLGVAVRAGHAVGDAEQARPLGERDLLEHRCIHRLTGASQLASAAALGGVSWNVTPNRFHMLISPMAATT